ncbi:MAG TPA: hypothetical protein VHT27_01845 [Solirubrobacteraceae bacterium]|nr:hypothetical protein [Solirubrobacteraceae bacterium]
MPKPKKLEDKWFMLGWEREPALLVTVKDEGATSGARAGVAGRLLEAIDQLIETLGSGVPPVVAGAVPGESITVLLDDPLPGAQTAIPVEFTHSAAVKVKDLIELEGQDLFASAIKIGPSANKYVDFVRLVSTTGVSITWRPRDEKPAKLDPDRATRQHALLSSEPELRRVEMTLIGVLYRVISDPTKIEGSIGIKLAKESRRPPWQTGSWINVHFNRHDLEATIKDGLIGEPVEARVEIPEPVPGTGLWKSDLQRVELRSIKSSPTPLSIEALLSDEEE